MNRLAQTRYPGLLVLSVVAALSHFLVRDAGHSSSLVIGLKGAGVALLAAWVLAQQRTRDFVMLALIMALGAAGDMAIEIELVLGALCFLAGHLVAIWLYARHRRENHSNSQRAAAVALTLLVPLLAWQLDPQHSLGIAVYGLALGAMAASAWLSRFSRYHVGLGALLFVVSDLLIFARFGPLSGDALPDLLIWPCYYAGQFLIATGVVLSLRSFRQTA